MGYNPFTNHLHPFTNFLGHPRRSYDPCWYAMSFATASCNLPAGRMMKVHRSRRWWKALVLCVISEVWVFAGRFMVRHGPKWIQINLCIYIYMRIYIYLYGHSVTWSVSVLDWETRSNLLKTRALSFIRSWIQLAFHPRISGYVSPKGT